jgi:peptidoglycan hydrolase CwlO-like protein
MKKGIVLVSLIALFVWLTVGSAKAEGCDNPGGLTDPGVITSCISKYNGILDAIAKANSTNKQQLQSLQSQLSKLQGQIKGLDTQLKVLEKGIFDREVKVGVKRELLSAKVKQDYLRKREESIMRMLFSADSAADFFKDAVYRDKLAKLDKGIIETVVGEISDLNNQSINLAAQKLKLAGLSAQVDKQADFLEAEVNKASKYESDLGGKISALSARQQQLLADKTGTFTTSVGDVPLADDPAARPDYNPGFSPAFAMFSFGAPHFKGMSQYGAFGRAKSGQSVETILKAYYGNGIEIKKDYSTSININVTGYGKVDIETYVKRIYEMPTSWGDQGGMEALKAQAVAARSYALARTNNGASSICATEACQVYKPANKGGKWDEAVNATRGWVLVTGGKPFSAWYASTSGGYQEAYSYEGYTTPGFWDTTSNWTRWADGAYEKVGGSPWFYKGWYKSRSGKTCGRSHPWLSMNEFADMVNAAIVVEGGGDAGGIFPEDVRSCWGGSDNPWSKDRLATEADKFGGRVTNVSSVRVEHGSNGVTNKVVLGTNRGEVIISGANFKRAFNLRAPGALSLKSGLFNIEKK